MFKRAFRHKKIKNWNYYTTKHAHKKNEERNKNSVQDSIIKLALCICGITRTCQEVTKLAFKIINNVRVSDLKRDLLP